MGQWDPGTRGRGRGGQGGGRGGRCGGKDSTPRCRGHCGTLLSPQPCLPPFRTPPTQCSPHCAPAQPWPGGAAASLCFGTMQTCAGPSLPVRWLQRSQEKLGLPLPHPPPCLSLGFSCLVWQELGWGGLPEASFCLCLGGHADGEWGWGTDRGQPWACPSAIPVDGHPSTRTRGRPAAGRGVSVA